LGIWHIIAGAKTYYRNRASAPVARAVQTPTSSILLLDKWAGGFHSPGGATGAGASDDPLSELAEKNIVKNAAGRTDVN